MVSHSASNYDYHFIMKGLAKEFEGKFNFPGKYIEKCKFFSVSIFLESTKLKIVWMKITFFKQRVIIML